MHSDIDHVILTRFNLPSQGFESLVRAREGWLRGRITLFERYCIPSVRAQTNQSFRWIIYFDPESPEWLKQRIHEHTEEKIYIPVFRTSVDCDELISDIRDVTGANARRLITTNLDNDDGLAKNFIQRLQEVAPPSGRSAIYLARGLIKSGSHLYLRSDRNNAFASVAEDWTSPATCWADWHTRLGKSMPSLELRQEPGWLQVVHGSNVSNRVRGQLVAPGRYAHLFPTGLEDVATPRPKDIAIDMFIAQPGRFARDSGRTIAKTIAIRLLGKEFLDRAKSFIASRRLQSAYFRLVD